MAYTTVNKSSLYQNNVLWTGNGTTDHAITGVGFQPDYVWAKHRNGASGHHWYDVIRGVEKRIRSDTNAAETTASTGLTAFGSDGFTVGTDSGLNSNSNTFVGWNWKAGGTGSANTDGSISSTVSANTTSGFSIVTYTGNGTQPSTVGHGLGVVPKMIITKSLSAVEGWYVYHASMGNDKSIVLNTTGAEYSSANWSSTTPTSSVFTLGGGDTNTSGRTMVAYCFAEVAGYSKIGSYEGTGAGGDNTFIFTGFKPSFIMIKNTESAEDWITYDNLRYGYNEANYILRPNTDAIEDGLFSDIFSNGFKIRGDNGKYGSAHKFIYYAVGQTLVGTNNIPCTAR